QSCRVMLELALVMAQSFGVMLVLGLLAFRVPEAQTHFIPQFQQPCVVRCLWTQLVIQWIVGFTIKSSEGFMWFSYIMYILFAFIAPGTVFGLVSTFNNHK